jgi:hypothetical protein
MAKRNTAIVGLHGTMWARNAKNIAAIPRSGERYGKGVYVLFDGSMPVYVGKGNIRSRIRRHQNKVWGQLWDRFSWYGLHEKKYMHDVEALMLRVLPRFLRSMNRQSGNFVNSDRKRELDTQAITIKRKLVAKRKQKRRKKR